MGDNIAGSDNYIGKSTSVQSGVLSLLSLRGNSSGTEAQSNSSADRAAALTGISEEQIRERAINILREEVQSGSSMPAGTQKLTGPGKEPESAAAKAEYWFNRFDSNERTGFYELKGWVSQTELNRSEKEATSVREKELISALKTDFDVIKRLNNDWGEDQSFTLEDMKMYFKVSSGYMDKLKESLSKAAPDLSEADRESVHKVVSAAFQGTRRSFARAIGKLDENPNRERMLQMVAEQLDGENIRVTSNSEQLKLRWSALNGQHSINFDTAGLTDIFTPGRRSYYFDETHVFDEARLRIIRNLAEKIK